MVEPNNVFQFTTNYVSTTSRSVVNAITRSSSSTSSDPFSSPTISPSIVSSFNRAIPELNDERPSSSNPESNLLNVSPTDLPNFEASKNKPMMKWNALCVQALLYPIAVVIYLLVGAAAFTAIEHNHEEMVRRAAANQEMQSINELQQAIETVLSKFNISKNFSEEILSNVTLWCEDYSRIQSIPHEWEFLPAFYFSATIITTIGKV